MIARILFAALLVAGTAARAAPDDYDHIERGRYLATVGDCVACHKGPNGPFGGGTPLETPFGNIYPPNITPDMATGIGAWTEEDFWNAMHHGSFIRASRTRISPG